MTLVVVAANPHFIVQVSDRRITAAAARVLSEESNKTIVWTTEGARFLVGYTGVAGTTDKIDTHFLLCELIQDCAPRASFDPFATIELVGAELGKVLQKRKPYRGVALEAKRLTVSFTGILYDDAGVGAPVHAQVSNFQRWGKPDEVRARSGFDVQHFEEPLGTPWPTLISAIGAWNVVTSEDYDRIGSLLVSGKPPRAVRDWMLSMLPEWALRAHGTVGLQASSVIVTADLNSPPRTRYHSSVNSPSIFEVSQVFTTPQICMAMVDPEITAGDEGGRPLAVPRVDPRRRCPCGSGKVYRLCHGPLRKD